MKNSRQNDIRLKDLGFLEDQGQGRVLDKDL